MTRIKRSNPSEAGWRCPRCGRRFRLRTREHSCDLRSLAAHLDRASTQIRETFDALTDALSRIGPHAVVPVKTMIVVRAGSNFAGVVVRKDSLDVEFVLRRSISHPRIRKTDQVGPTKFSHHTRLSSPADVDSRLESWLREAYAISARVSPA